MPLSPTVPIQGEDPIQKFQLTQAGVKEKSSKDYGEKLSKEIYGYVMSGLQGYFYNRNARFVKNRNYANGRINVQAMFQDRFQFNAKQNYVALNWNALQIVNRITSGLVGRWMRRGEKVQVTAIDTLSVKEKQEAYENVEFLLHNREMLKKLEQESGVAILPKNQELPTDQEELLLWQPQIQRLPEEILFETGCNDVLSSNGWFDVLKEKMLHDAAETLFVGTYTYMDDNGVIHVEWLKPENCIYSYSEYPDFRDTSWRGYLRTRKISELRRMYGKEFNPDNPLALTEQQLWEIAQSCKDFQYWNNLQWTDIWVASFMRPYDEWNCRVMEFELKTVDSEPYTKTVTNLTGSTYLEKGMPKTRGGKPTQKKDNQEIIADTNWNIYRGVYIPDLSILLEWGIKKNMIRPQDPKEIGNAEFSYSFFMPQNYAMRNMAIPEKIEAAVDGMILAMLKMQQVMARVIPTGWVIDETVLQNVDYGLGDAGNKGVNHVQQFFQTGLLYYHGLDADGQRVAPPIQELANSGFAAQMQALIQNYQFNYQALKDELGEDPNLITAAVQPRVTGENVEASRAESENATDYIYNAYAECMKITSRKVSCLLKDSVTYGASAYRKIVNEDAVGLRQFTTNIKFLPSQFEIDKFEAMMNLAMQSNQDLILFINPFQLMQIAKEDVKMAWAFFNRGQKKLVAHQQQMARENQDATFKAQQASAITAEEEKRKTESNKGDIDLEQKRIEGEWAAKNAVISMATSLLSKGVPIDASLKPLLNATVENLLIPLLTQNEEAKAEIMGAMNPQQAPQPEMEEQQMMMQQNNQSQPQPMAV